MIWDHKATKVCKVFLAHKETKVSKDHRVTWDLKVMKDCKAYLVHKGIKV